MTNAAITDEPVAIVGMGCLFPKADSLGAYWANLKNKLDGVGPVPATHWRPEDYFDSDPKRPDFTYARRGGFLDPYPFAPGDFGVAPRDLDAIDTAQLLGLVVARMALDDAGLLNPEADRRRIATILGVTGTLELVVPLGARLGHPMWRAALRDAGVASSVADDVVRRIGEQYVGWQENSFPGLLGNVVAGRIANRLDLGGTNCVVDAACASSLSAIHLAAMELAAGRADAVLTGGVDTFNDIFMYMCFSKTPALSPTGDVRPFDVSADGTILGEGIGMLVLKRLSDATRTGDRIYAVIRGVGTSSDGKGNAVYAPVAAGQERALRQAYERSGISPATVELIEAHGTGTKVGDAVEIEALASVFGPAERPRVALGSVKSQIGHTKAAAGAAGIIKAALALHHQVLPPTAKVKQPATNIGPAFYVNSEKRPWLPRDGHPRRAGVSSFGFGGSNFHAVLEEHPTSKCTPDWSGDVQIVAVSAEDRASLGARLKKLVSEREWPWLRSAAAQSRREFDGTQPFRVTGIIERGKTDLGALAAAVARGQDAPGLFFGEGPPPKLGMLFPGQGSQFVGMLRDLACQFPVFRDVLAEADRAFAAGMVSPPVTRLSDFIYPPTAYAPDARAKQDEDLRDTTVAQPALGAVCLAALQVLCGFGVRPDAAAGHSFGELTALCAAGCYDAPSLFALSQLRGRLMASQSLEDSGAMLAVMASAESVEAAVAAENIDVVVANRNGPAQAVLSGRTTEVERAAKALDRDRVKHVRLPVAAAFHSPLVASAEAPFREALEPIDFRTAQLTVFANSTSQEYPRDPQAARDLLAAQLARPVDFMKQIENMYSAGVRAFLEVGPGQTLTRLVGQILAGRGHCALALDSCTTGEAGLALTLARLAALGLPVRLPGWDPAAPEPSPARGLIVPISGANYRRPPTENRPPAPQPQDALPRTPAVPREIMANDKPKAPAKERSDDVAQLNRALQVTQESLIAFQKLQEQTADLHRLFLEQQAEAQRTLQTLLAGQQQLLGGDIPVSVAGPPARPSPQPPAPKAKMIAPPPAPKPPSPNPPVPIQATANGRVPKIDSPLPRPVSHPAPVAIESELRPALLAIVAEKTGYPTEMLNLDMGLDADLGIDSIKRVEILSALQDKLPYLPAVPPDRLGSLHTLREVIEFLEGGLPSVSESTPTIAAIRNATERSDSGLTQVLIEVVADKTGYPSEMLDLDMGLDADLGIDSIKRVEILSAVQERLPELPPVPPERLGSLHTLREVVDFLTGGPSEKKGFSRVGS